MAYEHAAPELVVLRYVFVSLNEPSMPGWVTVIVKGIDVPVTVPVATGAPSSSRNSAVFPVNVRVIFLPLRSAVLIV